MDKVSALSKLYTNAIHLRDAIPFAGRCLPNSNFQNWIPKLFTASKLGWNPKPHLFHILFDKNLMQSFLEQSDA